MQTIESNMSVISACVRVVAVMWGMLWCCTVTLGLGQGREFGHPHVVVLILRLLVYACECGATSTTVCPTEGSEEVFGTGTVHKLVVCTSTWIYSGLERLFCESVRFRSSMSVNYLSHAAKGSFLDSLCLVQA